MNDTTMIERVATAIASTGVRLFNEGVRDSKIMAEGQARAAIEAMREPTTEMILACADLPCSQQEVWELSINAALAAA